MRKIEVWQGNNLVYHAPRWMWRGYGFDVQPDGERAVVTVTKREEGERRVCVEEPVPFSRGDHGGAMVQIQLDGCTVKLWDVPTESEVA